MNKNTTSIAKNEPKSFISDIETYLTSEKIPYIISNSNGTFGRTTNTNKYREIDSTLGALQSVAAFSGIEISNNLTTDSCMPIISYIGDDNYLTTTQFEDTTISYVAKHQLNKNDINSRNTIYNQTCDATGTFLTNDLENTKTNLDDDVLKLKDQNNRYTGLDNLELENYNSIFLSNLATIHAARDDAILNSNITASKLPVLYIPYTIDNTHYLIVSKKIESDTSKTPYKLKNEIYKLKNSKIIDFWKQQEPYKTICDIAKEYRMI